MSVRSFSEIAWSYALSTPMYPTNATEKMRVEDKGSIFKSIRKEKDELFTTSLKTTSNAPCHPTLMEDTVRVVTFCAIQILVAPIGIVYNALAAGYYKMQNASNKTTYEYLKACGSDCKMALIPLIAVFAYKCIKATFKNLTPNTQRIYLQKLILGIYLALGSGSVCATVAAGLDPKQSVHILVWNENRTPYFKSIALYKDFGICAQDGSLLKYNAKEDTETPYFYDTGLQAGKFRKAEGTLSDIYLSLKTELQSVLRKLGNEIKCAPPKDMSVNSIKHWAKSFGSASNETKKLLERYEILDRNLDGVVALLQGSFWAQKTELFHLYFGILCITLSFSVPPLSQFAFEKAYSYWDAGINIPKYPSSFPGSSSYPRSNSSSNSGPRKDSFLYKRAMGKIIEDITKLDSNSNYSKDPLKNHPLAKRLRQGQTAAAQILDLDSEIVNDSERRRAYKKLALKLHPDKTSSEYSKPLFEALTEANKFLSLE